MAGGGWLWRGAAWGLAGNRGLRGAGEARLLITAVGKEGRRGKAPLLLPEAFLRSVRLPPQVDLKLRVEKLDLAMAPPGGAGKGPSARLPREPKEDREERILALLGIVGTVLNLLVVIFVYIYTTI